MFAILVTGSSAVIESSIVRNTELLADGRLGMGLMAAYDAEMGVRANVVLRACLVEKNHTSGVHAQGSDVTLETSEVSDNLPQAGDGFYGRGLQTQPGEDETITSTATVRGCAFRRNYETGILVHGGSASIEDTVVEQTKVGSLDGELGDGIAVVSSATSDTSAIIRRVMLLQNERAGLASFGALVTLGDGRLECNPIDLHGDAHEGHSFDLIDEGGNTCGCEGVGRDCVTSSAMLAPPTTLPPAEL